MKYNKQSWHEAISKICHLMCFSLSLSLSSIFLYVFVSSIFPLRLPESASLCAKHCFQWDGRPSVLQGLRDQWDALFSDYSDIPHKRLSECGFFVLLLFGLSSFTKIWCCCYVLPRLGWADPLWDESRSLEFFLKMQKNNSIPEEGRTNTGRLLLFWCGGENSELQTRHV